MKRTCWTATHHTKLRSKTARTVELIFWAVIKPLTRCLRWKQDCIIWVIHGGDNKTDGWFKDQEIRSLVVHRYVCMFAKLLLVVFTYFRQGRCEGTKDCDSRKVCDPVCLSILVIEIKPNKLSYDITWYGNFADNSRKNRLTSSEGTSKYYLYSNPFRKVENR